MSEDAWNLWALPGVELDDSIAHEPEQSLGRAWASEETDPELGKPLLLRAPKVPLLRALWSPLVGLWGILKVVLGRQRFRHLFLAPGFCAKLLKPAEPKAAPRHCTQNPCSKLTKQAEKQTLPGSCCKKPWYNCLLYGKSVQTHVVFWKAPV